MIWILRGFFLAIPPGIERAAAVDGATTAQIFRLIVLPISLSPLFATGVFAFIEAWNEFFFALILTRQSARTVPLVISQFAGQYQTVFGQMMAAAALAIAPVVALAILFREHDHEGFRRGHGEGLARMAEVELRAITKSFGKVAVCKGVDLQVGDGRVRDTARAVRLRQDDDAQSRRRAGGCERRRHPDRMGGGSTI